MEKRNRLAKALAIVGVVLLALPLLIPFVFSLRFIGRPGGLRIDYLMPFEVYPVTLVGTALLLWASLRARVRRKAVAWSIAGMIGGLVLAGVSARVTGIATSVEQLETWRYVLTAALGAFSLIAQVALIVVGVLIIRDLSRTTNTGAGPVTDTPPGPG